MIIELDINLARQAIKLPKFQEFMTSKMKITDEQLTQLIKGCGKCWRKFNTPGSINKIMKELLVMVDQGLIRQRANRSPAMRCTSREEAVEYIKNLDDFVYLLIYVR